MKHIRADEFCDLVTDGTHDSPKRQQEGYYLITSKHIKGSEIDYDNAYKISESDYLQIIQRSKVDQWDVLISMIGTCGIAHIVTEEKPDFAVKNVGILKTGSKKKALWLYYYLTSPQGKNYLETIKTGSTQPYISLSELRKMPILLPEEKKRDAICSFLLSIDEKISINTKVIKNLAMQAEAVFDKYYYSSLKQQPFTSLISILGGGTPKTDNPDYWGGTIPFFTPKDVGTPYTFRTEKYISDEGLEHCNSRLYSTNTAFVTARGTVGKVSLAGRPMAMNQSCYALSSEEIDPILVYFYALKAVSSLKHKANGAVFDAIVTRDFDSEMINALSIEDSKTVLSVIDPIMKAIHNISVENLRLSSLRDILLPKLISSEIDVSDIEPINH